MISFREMRDFFEIELPELLKRIENLEKKVENLEQENTKLAWQIELK